ncbi:Diol dehydratase-reactivating factor alpha subunit [Koleobacter methoxysyntrophicus]|uniref:Diol dehydratase-reactivating factor alpha subunit n=1 Tax=Koleobacter methoxysyntrophicus TaxID=2751313 RepID=A0A8A0RKI6_9FIRM|nr:diol dehydratase reactivase subunit alpha [Koleobacter methoxysyntrophicus]QSQ08224.1 Diol dehydratase-reactivating factor alpha subunit [Koleobacter methoxysyntrophicus]
MKIIAGVDIGNSTTETALFRLEDETKYKFISSSIVRTTGIKGTVGNISGIIDVLKEAAQKAGIVINDIDLILLNEATPVIGDVAMETITETIITESTMIGHNPSTPGGVGLGTGNTVDIRDLDKHEDEKVICLIPREIDFEEAAAMINTALEKGVDVQGAIVQKDDGVLISNRVKKNMPIVDEVSEIHKVPKGMPAAVEVARPGETIKTLSNPYGIATVFNLNSEETKMIVPIARALIGNRSAVVIKTPKGDIKERKIPAGTLTIVGERNSLLINIQEGSEKIMETVEKLWPISDVKGESGTNAGGMLERVRQIMSEITGQGLSSIKIQDILAIDTMVPQKIRGALAGEFAMENGVALAAMVKTSRLPMEQIARKLKDELGIDVHIQGVEANMAVLGALTTPGSDIPIAVLDMGGGSTDAALMNKERKVTSIHLAGAGDMVTMLINSELGLNDIGIAEDIKRYSLAKVETLYSIRLEDGTVKFFAHPLKPELFARVVLLKENVMVPLPTDHSMERIRNVRRRAKREVFVTNAVRALSIISPANNIRHIPFVVLVGGSALDFEIPDMISDSLARYGIVCGRANVRGKEGPRNAVATGLVLSYISGR